MPIDFIRVTTTDANAPFARDLVILIGQIRTMKDQLEKVKEVMDHNHNGVLFASLETVFGLPAGQGQMVYDLVNGTLLALTGNGQNSNALSLIQRVG